MTSTALAFPDPRLAGKPRSLHPGREPLPAADGGAGDRRSAARWRQPRTSTPPRQLVLSHLRLVVAVSRNYLGYGLPQADLIQEGNVGLMKAVRRFDPERGVRLVSFALHWIRAEMHEYILRNWRLVKVATTKAQRKLFFNLRSMKARSAALSRRRGEGDIAKDLGVKPEEVRRDGDAPRRPRRGARPDAGRRRELRRRRSPTSPTARTSPRRSSSASRPSANRTEGPADARSPSSTTAAAASSRRAGCARTIRRRCRSSPTSTASRPSGSARSRARR